MVNKNQWFLKTITFQQNGTLHTDHSKLSTFCKLTYVTSLNQKTGLPAHIKPGKLFHLGSFATAYLTF